MLIDLSLELANFTGKATNYWGKKTVIIKSLG